MPWIDRRTIRQRLLLIGRMLKQVFEAALAAVAAHIDFLDGISDAVAAVACTMGITGLGRQLQSHATAAAVVDNSRSEAFPLAAHWFVHGVAVAGPVLHSVAHSVGFGPCDSDRVHTLLLPQIGHDPLRVGSIVLAGESL